MKKMKIFPKTFLYTLGLMLFIVGIARTLVSDAPVILADEPTGNLDEDTASEITGILKDCAHRMNKCVIVVTHSNALAEQADTVFRLNKGKLLQV